MTMSQTLEKEGGSEGDRVRLVLITDRKHDEIIKLINNHLQSMS